MEILYFAKSGEHPGELGRGGEKHNVIIVDFFFYSLFFFSFSLLLLHFYLDTEQGSWLLWLLYLYLGIMLIDAAMGTVQWLRKVVVAKC